MDDPFLSVSTKHTVRACLTSSLHVGPVVVICVCTSGPTIGSLSSCCSNDTLGRVCLHLVIPSHPQVWPCSEDTTVQSALGWLQQNPLQSDSSAWPPVMVVVRPHSLSLPHSHPSSLPLSLINQLEVMMNRFKLPSLVLRTQSK